MFELDDCLRDSKIGRIYIIAFPDKSKFKKHIIDIAWETEVWIADNPNNIIHFNGDIFIGQGYNLTYTNR